MARVAADLVADHPVAEVVTIVRRELRAFLLEHADDLRGGDRAALEDRVLDLVVEAVVNAVAILVMARIPAWAWKMERSH
jgi:hypothetical protein